MADCVLMSQRQFSQRAYRQCTNICQTSTAIRLTFGSRRRLGHIQPVGTPTQLTLPQQGFADRRDPRAHVFPFDQAWAPNVDAASLAPQLFAMSLFPYLCFLFFLTKSGKTPPLTLFGFYFLLVFVGATIPAGIYAKSHYGTSLANVDWLHGVAESLLTVTNLFIVLGLRQGIREAEAAKKAAAAAPADEGVTSKQEAAATAAPAASSQAAASSAVGSSSSPSTGGAA